MISIYALKARFQSVLRPLAQLLANAGVTANQVTIAALGLSLAHGGWIALDALSETASLVPLLLLPLTLLVRMALNAIDGMLAREHGQQSQLGAILNEVADMVSDAGLYLPLALVAGLSGIAIVLGVVAAIIGEAVGILGASLAGERRYDGPMGKSDRAVAYAGIGLLAYAGLAAENWVTALLWLIAGLAVLTIINRARAILSKGQKA